MVVFLRLISALAFLLASAASYGQQCTQYRVVIGAISSGWLPSADAACSSAAAAATASNANCGSTSNYGGTAYSTCGAYTAVGIVNGQCRTSRTSAYGMAIGAPPIIDNFGVATQTAACPFCQTVAGLTTGSSTQYVDFGNASPTQMASWLGKSKNFCDPVGCTASGMVEACGKAGSQVSCTLKAPKFGGSACDPNADPTVGDGAAPGTGLGQNEPNVCEAGKCPGTVNGVSVCVVCNSSGGTSSTSSTSTTTTSTTADPPTSDTTETTTTVTCDEEGTCTKTTTTTYTKPDGTKQTKVDTEKGTKDGLCASESNLSICKDSAFSGSCGETGAGEFTCDGDSATCAIAKAANQQKCLAEKLSAGMTTEALTAGRALGTNTDPVKDPKTTAGGLTTMNVGTTFNNLSNPYGDACPGNLSINVAGATVVIPIADYCSLLQMIGNALHAVTLLAAVVLVLKGVG